MAKIEEKNSKADMVDAKADESTTAGKKAPISKKGDTSALIADGKKGGAAGLSGAKDSGPKIPATTGDKKGINAATPTSSKDSDDLPKKSV